MMIKRRCFLLFLVLFITMYGTETNKTYANTNSAKTLITDCTKDEQSSITRCGIVLFPANTLSKYAIGTAFISFKNSYSYSLMFHALSLPDPSELGHYKGYELIGYTSKKDILILKLTKSHIKVKTPYANKDNWEGEKGKLPNGYKLKTVRFAVRPYNPITNKSGPVVLQSPQKVIFKGLK